MQKRLTRALLAAVCAVPMVAAADIDFRGFASLGGGVYSEDDATYTGVDDTFTADPFTKFALQVKSEVNDRTQVTGQLIARGTNDYQLEAEWAYATIKVTEALDFRVGRIRSPFFLYSDFLDVGYAYPWVRPPAELYRLPFTTVEGVDILHDHSVGSWSGSFQLFYGGLTEETLIDDFTLDLELNDYAGANYSLSNDWLTFRVSYNETVGTASTPEEIDTLLFDPLIANGFQNVVDQLSFDEVKAQFYGVGLNIDIADFIVAAEYTVLDFDRQTFLSSDDSWYVMLGKRFGDVTLHLTYAEQEGDPDYSVLDLIPDIPQTTALRGGVFQAIDNDKDTTITAGIRYEYGPSSAFKFEVTSVEEESLRFDGGIDTVEGTLVSFTYDLVF